MTCVKEWKRQARNSSRFDAFKLYTIKLKGNEESFFKIGVTFLTVEDRFNFKGLKVLPYNIIGEIEIVSSKPEQILILEKEYQKRCRKFKYIPRKRFSGMFECFSSIDPIRNDLKQSIKYNNHGMV